ncbi:helix-turn-helix domain-containing protein [Streptomyces sp. NBC_00503]|uniref:helix-turn-helix domain-containing protein n=1 Tax=Streptomyces sp. NBC_00503 TaxID=2903659 RepID=UPI002E81921A|nr:helix-turn-helix transcriptional regulator [Streptomyces sp. NBC_00503]WUD81024.1 helix-turn-helix domain-containing protein [Streptomyces sp. NBC_00503]
MTSSERESPGRSVGGGDGREGADPGRLRTVAGFIEALRALKAVEGLSLRELQRRTGLPHTTIAHALQPERPSLPPWDRVRALLVAFGVPEAALPRWKEAWTRLRLSPDGHTGPAPAGDPQAPLTPIEVEASTPVHGPGPDPAPAPEEPTPGVDARGLQDLRVPRTVRSPRRGGPRWRRAVTHTVALVLGAALGAAAMAATVPPPTPAAAHAGYPVEEQGCPSASPAPPAKSPKPAPSTGSSAAPSSATSPKAPAAWVARPAGDQQILSGTDFVLPVVSPVAEGDALVVSLMLTSTCPGRVEVTDTGGDEFRIVGDETDSSRHRTMLLAAFHVRPLTTADSIHVVYPHASKYNVTVDEFRGVGGAVGRAQAHGESGRTAFSTGSSRLDCAAGDLLVGAVGTNTGTAPAFAAEWTALPESKLSSYRLTSAYRTVPAAQSCALTGTTTAQWGAVMTALR